jgi:hypothetical protein
MPFTDFSCVYIVGFSYNMTLEVTLPMLIPENVFNIECFVCKVYENITGTWGFARKFEY